MGKGQVSWLGKERVCGKFGQKTYFLHLVIFVHDMYAWDGMMFGQKE